MDLDHCQVTTATPPSGSSTMAVTFIPISGWSGSSPSAVNLAIPCSCTLSTNMVRGLVSSPPLLPSLATRVTLYTLSPLASVGIS